jgi:hypothetical protein
MPEASTERSFDGRKINFQNNDQNTTRAFADAVKDMIHIQFSSQAVKS